LRDDDDRNQEDIEKELHDLIEQLKHQQKKDKLLSVTTYGLHKNFGLNVLLMYLVNLLLFMVTTGLTSLLKVSEVPGFFIGVLLFTLLEIIVKMMVFRYFLKYVLQSFGLLLLVLSVVLMYASVSVTPGLTFIKVTDLIGFSIVFLGLRFMLTYYVKMHQFKLRK